MVWQILLSSAQQQGANSPPVVVLRSPQLLFAVNRSDGLAYISWRVELLFRQLLQRCANLLVSSILLGTLDQIGHFWPSRGSTPGTLLRERSTKRNKWTRAVLPRADGS